uniref:Uncharacterized protein n=1 Tax=Drosophila pseudoobscura pseudoobscura TaxID=46245 RepID=A0A0R3NWI4_DROPS
MSATSSVETPTTQNLQSKTAIVISEQNVQSQYVKRSFSVSLSVSSSTSLGAAGSAISLSVDERTAVIAPPQLLLQSSTSSTSTNVAATIAAVHQRKSYSLEQKESSLRHQVKPNQQLANISLPVAMTSSEVTPSLTGASVAILGTLEATSRHCTNATGKIAPLTSQKMHRTIPSDKSALKTL